MMTNREDKKMDTPAVHIPPPIIIVGFLTAGLLADHFAKTEFEISYTWLKQVGIGLCVFGLGVILWCTFIYKKSQTSIMPHTADSNMIETGPFGVSRNPIYLSMMIIFIGICFIFNAPLALVFLIPAYLALRFYVIAREEAYLERRFGAEYLSYQARVRRWI